MTISQREAQRLRRRVLALEQLEATRNNAWAREWPGGVHIATLQPDRETYGSVMTARKLGHAVVGSIGSDGTLMLYALRLKP